MEAFSAYRDPGTGIQPFLTPVAPLDTELFARLLLPVNYILGVTRIALVLVLVVVYVVLVNITYLVFVFVPALHRLLARLLTYVLGRSALFLLGFSWISVDTVSRKRGRPALTDGSWNPQSGDLIISNWVSWVELVWLAFRFNPVFVLPIIDAPPSPATTTEGSLLVTLTTGRRTGTGSANMQLHGKRPATRIPISGFRQVSLLQMIRFTGRGPEAIHPGSEPSVQTLAEIQQTSKRPVVVFPECTTSNGRGLLRFAELFHQGVPVTKYQVFVMSVRYDPPTTLRPTPTLSIPSRSLSPLSHAFRLATSLAPQPISIRLLEPSDSPSSPLFTANEYLSGYVGDDQLSEICSALIARIGKLKRMGMGWEDKVDFIEFYRKKSR